MEYVTNKWCSPVSWSTHWQDNVCYLSYLIHYSETQDAIDHVPVLQAIGKEADIRIILRVKHASDEGYAAIVITAEDTDIFVSALVSRSFFHSHRFRANVPQCGNSSITFLKLQLILVQILVEL